MNPLGQSNLTIVSPLSSSSGNWMENLPFRLATPSAKRSPAFNRLIDKFFNNPTTPPNKADLNSFLLECMFHGETWVLIDILPHVETLHLNSASRHGDLSIALNTLLGALRITLGRAPISELSLVHQQLGHNDVDMLFEILSRLPELQSLEIHTCVFDVTQAPPDCARLHALNTLYFGHMKGALPVLDKILAASQLTELHIDAVEGSRGQHDKVAETLSKQTALATLGLCSCSTLDPYYTFLETQTTVKDLRLFNIRLRDADCGKLYGALQPKSTVAKLSLPGCWPSLMSGLNSEAAALGQLLSLPSLVEIDLSMNFLFDPAAPVLQSLAAHPKLKTLSFDGCNLGDKCIDALALVFTHNEILTSITLPYINDKCYKPLADAIQANKTLQRVSIPYVEKLAESRAELVLQRHPNYAALVKQVRVNFLAATDRQERDHEDRVAFIRGGMKAVLAGLGGRTSNDVPSDIAAYAADFAIHMNGERDMMNLPLLNKSAHAEGSKARDRAQNERQAREKPDSNRH